MSSSTETSLRLDAGTDALREALRSLLLPVDPSHEGAAVEAARAELERQRVDVGDQADYLRLETAQWARSGAPSAGLERAVRAALRAGDPLSGERVAAKYFALHLNVLRKQHLLGFEDASAFLSHLRLILRLAQEDAMSAAQIARLMSARDRRVTFSWQALQDILARLDAKPVLDLAEVEALFAWDVELEERLFADADFRDAAALVGEFGREFGFPGDLESLLLRLFSPDAAAGQRHGPYLQLLHYQCVICEFFDHAATVLYEFAPRGNVAEWLFSQYPGDLAGAGNPFLNNAKSVDRLDLPWARSKDRQGLLSSATALVEILAGLEDMGFAARQELAGWLRRWLLRVIRLTRPLARSVPEQAKPEAIAALLTAVASGETHTAGILEQRVVDVIAMTRHRLEEGWRGYGVGDAVNASNVSRRKLGDCEFQNASTRRLVAYEAHGGALSSFYVDGHAQTLARVVPLRVEEWKRIADLGEWTFEIIFVAHSFSCLPTSVMVGDVHIQISFTAYADLIASAPRPADLTEAVSQHVNRPLNERRTPQRVRDRYLDITA